MKDLEIKDLATEKPANLKIKIIDALQKKPLASECHGKKDVKIGDGKNAYYDEIHRRLKKDPALYKKYYQDGKVSVSELGGWECAKCHY